MSLETLLEAAKYLEYRTEAKARGEEPHDYHTFAKLSASHGDSFLYKPTNKVSTNKINVVDRTDVFTVTSDDTKDKRRAGGAGTREVHNKLEKNRRAHLKECFETLKKQLPNMDERKTSNLSILRGALRYIQTLKRKEREYEQEMERLAREKIAAQQRLAALKKDVPLYVDHVDFNNLIADEDNETTTTASECGPLSDLDDDEDGEDEAPRNQSSLSKSPSSTGEGSPSSSNSAISMSTIQSSSTAVAVEPTSSGPSFSTSTRSVIGNINQTISTYLQSFETPGSSTASASSVWSTNKPNLVISSSDSTLKTESPKIQASNHDAKSVIDHAHISRVSQVLTEKNSISEANTDAKTVLMRPNNAKMVPSSSSIYNPSSKAPPTTVPNNTTGLTCIESPVISSVVTVPMSSSSETSAVQKTPVPQSVRGSAPAPMPTTSSSTKIVTPMTLVSPQTVVNVSQVAAASKPIIINQATGMTRVTMVPNPTTQLTLTPVNVKPSGAVTTYTNVAPVSTVTSTSSHQVVHHTAASILSSSAETQPAVNANPSSASKSTISQIIHSTVSQRPFPGQPVLSQVSQVSPVSTLSNVGRHLVTTTLKPAGNASHLRTTLPQLAGVTHVAHVMSQAPVAAASVGQIVSAGTHMSPVTPIMAPLSVVSHGTSHMISQRQQLGKVLAASSPILKSVGQINQIPIIQRQFLQPALSSTHAQPVVKPVVVVSMPNMVSTSSVVQPPHSGQHASVSVPVSQ